MLYYSTNNRAVKVSLQEAVVNGLAPDRGLYMPEIIPQLPVAFFEDIADKNLPEIASVVAGAFFADDISKDNLDAIVTDTLNFDIPVKEIEEGIYVLELFHGPTFAFKDVGARFMARMLSFFVKERQQEDVKVLEAT